MRYRKISVEMVVPADEADSVAMKLNEAMDGIEFNHSIFDGEIHTMDFKPFGTQQKSALTHTIAAGVKTVNALKIAHRGMKTALRAVL